LVNLFRKADDLAFAMEARCYVGRGRTRLGKAKIRSADVVAAAVGCVLFVATAVLF
jgi:energy-coupling factor transporter transmembrane protein EcfT